MEKVRNWAAGIKSEWHKITWPTQHELVRKTTAVIVVSVILGAAIAVMDMGFQNLVNAIAGLF